MPHAMTRTRANAIRAVGFSAGALLAVAAGAMALTGGADPASITPGDVKVPDLAPQQNRQEIYPEEIATWLSTAYRHDFAEETPEQPSTGPVQQPTQTSGTVRLVGVIGAGERSMAIVGVDAQQLLLAAGESGPDFRVEEIHDDHIVMVRGGQRSEVRLGERQGPLAGNISPGGLGMGASARAQGVQGQSSARAAAEERRSERDQYYETRRREAEQRRAAARAIEASGGSDEDAVPPAAMGNGNSFSEAVMPGGANGAAGGNGAAEGQTDARQTRGRQTGGRRTGGNGDSNN